MGYGAARVAVSFARRKSDRFDYGILHHFINQGGSYVRAPSTTLFVLWVKLIEDCSVGLEGKEFNIRQKEIAKLYRRMNVAEQGEYHRLIAEDHERWMRENGIIRA